MSATADRYGRLAADFVKRLRRVAPEAWSNASPCEGWTARDVVHHVVELSAGLAAGAGGDAAATVPSVDEDPVTAWQVASGILLDVLRDPTMAASVIETSGGPRSVEELSAGLCRDLLVHMWDLSRAAGLDDRLDPDEVRTAFAEMRPLDEMLSAPGLLGPKVEVAPDADEQARFIAFMGRRP